jgi:hypothetical protein
LRVAENIDRQKQMILNNYKKRELDIYKGWFIFVVCYTIFMRWLEE